MNKAIFSIAVPLVSAALGASAVVVAAEYNLTGTGRQMDVKMVEIAVGILSKEPKDNIAPAREWAVDVIDHYAQVPLTPEARSALINNKAVNVLGWGEWDSGGGYGESYNIPKKIGK